mmetsp:Transcript_54212/g.126173  ORF Transcript_54212/g.126173 Transcript_54212/m.126173 type:complete len:488 (-) Transcript_54212:132-1595(-)
MLAEQTREAAEPAEQAREAEAHEGRAYCGSVSAILLLVIALILCICATSWPWWDGPSSSEMFGEGEGTLASLSLWQLEVHTELGGHTETLTKTWAEACEHGHGAPSPHRCRLILEARGFIVMTVVLGFTALTVTMTAVALDCCLRPALHWFMRSAWLCLATALLNAIALLVAASLGTRDFLGTGTLAFSTALPTYLAASFTSLYQVVVTSVEQDVLSAQAEADPEKGRHTQNDDDEVEAWEEGQRHFGRSSTTSSVRVARHAGRRLQARLDHSSVVSVYGSKGHAVDRGGSTLAGPLGPLERLVLWTYENPFCKDIPLRMLDGAFNEVDQQGEGVINPEDLAKLLDHCGLTGSSGAMNRAIRQTKSEGSGKDLDRDEFDKFFRRVQEVNAREVIWKRRQIVDYFLCTFCCFLHLTLLWILLMGFFRARSHYPKPEAFFMVLDIMRLLFILLSTAFAVVVITPMVRLTWSSACRRTFMVPSRKTADAC